MNEQEVGPLESLSDNSRPYLITYSLEAKGTVWEGLTV